MSNYPEQGANSSAIGSVARPALTPGQIGSSANSVNQATGTGNRSQANQHHHDPKKLIKASYECFKKIIELDTQGMIADLNVIEATNTSNALVYKDFEYYLNKLFADIASLEEQIRVMERQNGALDELLAKLDKLQLVVEQLDEWSLELEVKYRKYVKK